MIERVGRAASQPDVDLRLVEVERGEQRAPTPRPVAPVRLRGERPTGALSPRENEVMALLAEGLSTKLIAVRLGRSPATIKIHRETLLRKLGAHNTAHAVSLWLERR